MKRQLPIVLCIIFVIITSVGYLAGCKANSSMSFTYSVTTGDKVKVTLNTTDGYTMNTENPFVVSKDGEEILTCQFLTKGGYEYYSDLINDEILESQNGRIIESGNKNNFDYIFYTIESNFVENDFFVRLNDQTSLIIGSLASEEEAKKCFDSLTFEIIK